MTGAGLVVGFVVGMTGTGGGALATPILVLLFGVPPLAAVSSDLVASAVMKPIGCLVHLRRGTVHWPLVRWLVVGSVPSAFAGVLLLRLLGPGERVQGVVRDALGAALLIAAVGLVVGARGRRSSGSGRGPVAEREEVPARPLPTLAVGVVVGLVVGMTSVGSGALVLVALLALYPRLCANRLIGTDLAQAVPLVVSAALAHLLFGDFRPGVTASLVAGAVPGVWLGSRLSSRAPERLLRAALVVVLAGSGTRMMA